MGVELPQGYGLTEDLSGYFRESRELQQSVTVGQPIPGLQIRLGDIEELQVKGPTVMKATGSVLTQQPKSLPNDWFRTGDQADLSDAGRIRIKGRIKEIIVTSTGEDSSDRHGTCDSDRSFFEQVMVVGEARPFITALAVVNESRSGRSLLKEFNVDPSG